jgi:NAD+ synthase
MINDWNKMNYQQDNRNNDTSEEYSQEWLKIDPEAEVSRICGKLIEVIYKNLRREGGVVGISGGIDSSVTLSLAVKALGPERVVGILMPERESNPASARLAQTLADQLGVETFTECISDVLQGFRCYERRDEAINRIIPEYQRPGWAAKIVLPTDLLEQNILNIFRLVVTDPDQHVLSKRLPKNDFQQIVAASNFKQRSRMSILYYQAESRNYAVIGTANKNEYELGFFVKYGDGGFDVNPIQHLFKTQIYQLAQYLDIPTEIQERTPTTDTYPGGCTQEEFFYRVPFNILDTVWFGYENGIDVDKIANALGLQREQVLRVISDIQSKKRSTEYLRMPPIIFKDSEQ